MVSSRPVPNRAEHRAEPTTALTVFAMSAHLSFSAPAGSLRDALGRASHVTPATPSIAAYGGVHLELDDHRAKITGADGETSVTAEIDVEMSAPGKVLLPPKPFATLLSKLPASTLVNVTLNENAELLVTPAGGNTYRLRPLVATFPAPARPSGEPVPVDFSGLADALAVVRNAVTREQPGVQLVSSGKRLVLNATDSYCLARAELASGGFGEFTGLIPLAILDRIARLAVTAVAFDTRSRLVAFHATGTVVVTRLLATPFPAVDTVLDAAPRTHIALDGRPVLDALGRLSAVAQESPVRVRIAGSKIELAVSNADLGSGAETATLSSPAPSDTEFHCRLPYLVNAFSIAEQLTVAYSGPVSPIFVSATEPVTATLVVMPVRV